MKEILTRTPINKTAARVVSRGEHYKSSKKVNVLESDFPLPVRAPNKAERRQSKAGGFIDLTGARRGRLTVLGIHSGHPSGWVVRCDCGTYSVRTAKAIKNEANEEDRCSECRNLFNLKKRDIWLRTGKDQKAKDFL